MPDPAPSHSPAAVAGAVIPAALKQLVRAAYALRLAALDLDLACHAAGNVAAFKRLYDTASLESLAEVQALLLAAVDRHEGSINTLGQAIIRDQPAERHRLNMAMARGQARAIASCTCKTCPTCQKAAEWMAQGIDPEKAFYEGTMRIVEPSGLLDATGRPAHVRPQ